MKRVQPEGPPAPARRSSIVFSVFFLWLVLAGLASAPLHASIPRDRPPAVVSLALIEGTPAAEWAAGAFPPARLELDISEGEAGVLRRVLVRQNPWSSFDPEGLAMFGLFDSYGDYFHEMGEVWKGYGDVTVGAVVATARAVGNLPSNTMGVINDVRELSQMDSSAVMQGVKGGTAQIGQGAKQAASDYGDRLANGDNRAWGQVVGTALTLGGAKGAQFAKVAEVAEVAETAGAGQVGTSAARTAAKTEQAVAEASKADLPKKTNPFTGPVNNEVVIVDPQGNAIPIKVGQQLKTSPDGKWAEVKDAGGKPAGIRLDQGHNPKNHPDPRSQQPHVHRDDVGATNDDGTPWLPRK